MKSQFMAVAALALSLGATVCMADATRDCILEGTVQKSTNADGQNVSVKFHSAEKYDKDSNCRVRSGEKLQFKMPADPRLKDAEVGSPVKYRYRRESDGSSQAELVSVGA